jgi:integrase
MSAYKDKDGRWRYRFARRGQRYSGSTLPGNNTKAAALALERQHIEKLERNTFTGAMPTVKEFSERFLEHQRARVRPLTIELNETQIAHMVKRLGRKRLDEVDSRDLATLLTEWSKSAAPTTINSRLGTVLRMFGLAREWKILADVPKVDALKVPKDTPRFLSFAEAPELVAASRFLPKNTNDWHSMIIVGLRTGLRIGELRGLQPADCDLARRAPTPQNPHGSFGAIRVSRSDPGRPDLEAGPTKGGKTRVVPLTEDAANVLIQRISDERKRLGAKWTPSTWIWPMRGDNARALPTGTCSHAIIRIAERAKLQDVGWHTLRHTYASWLVMQGVPLPVVQVLLGHYDIKQTMRYAHLAPGFAHHSAVSSLGIPLMAKPITPALPPGIESDDDE